RGRGDQYSLSTGFEMRAAGLVRLEEAGAFEHQIHTHRLVRQLAGIALTGNCNFAPVDDDGVLRSSDLARKAAVNRIVRKEQRIGLGIGQVVDCDEFQSVILTLEDSTRDKPPDP